MTTQITTPPNYCTTEGLDDLPQTPFAVGAEGAIGFLPTGANRYGDDRLTVPLSRKNRRRLRHWFNCQKTVKGLAPQRPATALTINN